MATPDFGVFAFGAAGRRPGRHRHVRLLLARRPGPAERVRVRGDRRRRASTPETLDTEKWNAHRPPAGRPDTRFTAAGSRSTTVNGDIYTNGDPAPTRNFILQNPTEAGQDWAIETHIDVADARRWLRAGRPAGPPGRRQLHQVRHHSPTRATPVLNRIELRSEVAGRSRAAAAPIRRSRTGTTERLAAPDQDRHELRRRVLVRRRRPGLAIASPVTNPMVDPRLRHLHARRAAAAAGRLASSTSRSTATRASARSRSPRTARR